MEVMAHSIFTVIVGYPAFKLISPVVDGVDRTQDEDPRYAAVHLSAQESINECNYLR